MTNNDFVPQASPLRRRLGAVAAAALLLAAAACGSSSDDKPDASATETSASASASPSAKAAGKDKDGKDASGDAKTDGSSSTDASQGNGTGKDGAGSDSGGSNSTSGGDGSQSGSGSKAGSGSSNKDGSSGGNGGSNSGSKPASSGDLCKEWNALQNINLNDASGKAKKDALKEVLDQFKVLASLAPADLADDFALVAEYIAAVHGGDKKAEEALNKRAKEITDSTAKIGKLYEERCEKK